MAEYRINSQNDTIEKIQLALEEMSLGIGLGVLCDIKVEEGADSSTIVFTTKEDRKIKQADFFWFGYFVGRDFEEKQCKKCQAKKKTAFKSLNSNKK